MKRLILGLVIGLFIGSAVTAIASTNQTVQAIFKDINFKVDDQDPVELTFLLHQGASYLPVRKAGEVLGYEVDYQTDPELIIYMSPASNDHVRPSKSPATEVYKTNWIESEQMAFYGIETVIDGNQVAINDGQNELFLTLPDEYNIGDTFSVETSQGGNLYIHVNDSGKFFFDLYGLMEYGFFIP